MTETQFPNYDPRVAASLEHATDDAGGLPGFLGIRHVDVGAGELHARVEVRDDLKTPFGNLHCAITCSAPCSIR
jgi:1,4-dihydroxy-2-naphthoyl-CoA hydrolase